MKHLLPILVLCLSLHTFAQKEGQKFCEGDLSEPYFYLAESTKYIAWGDTYYDEEFLGEKTLNGKTYKEYSQTWESGDVSMLYLREADGVVYQYEECCEDDTVRIPKEPKVGDTWKTAHGLASYEILSLDSELETPICEYKGLLVLKLTAQNGTFTFYYQRGYGYVGATAEDKLISIVTPRPLKELIEEKKD